MMYSNIGVCFCETVPFSLIKKGQFHKIFFMSGFFHQTNLSGPIRGALEYFFFGFFIFISKRYLIQKVTPLYV